MNRSIGKETQVNELCQEEDVSNPPDVVSYPWQIYMQSKSFVEGIVIIYIIIIIVARTF